MLPQCRYVVNLFIVDIDIICRWMQIEHMVGSETTEKSLKVWVFILLLCASAVFNCLLAFAMVFVLTFYLR